MTKKGKFHLIRRQGKRKGRTAQACPTEELVEDLHRNERKGKGRVNLLYAGRDRGRSILLGGKTGSLLPVAEETNLVPFIKRLGKRGKKGRVPLQR